MPLTSTDWVVIVGYLLINLLIGIYYRRRASGNTAEFFIAGRDVSWWLAGTSMVATTFAADPPLLVTGLVATQGIAGNWLWWNQCLTGMLTVFFFARYWRRAEIMTDVELTELRYSGKPAAFLRGLKAIYLGLLMNCLILGWVTRAMVDIIAVLLGPAIAPGKIWQLALGSHTLFHYTLGEPHHTALLICIFVLIPFTGDRKSTRLNSSHLVISYAVFCLKKKKTISTSTMNLLSSPSTSASYFGIGHG